MNRLMKQSHKHHSRNTRFLFVLMAAVFSTSTFAQTKHELTVQEAVDRAYQNVIDLKNKELDLKIQEAMNKGILGQALPQIKGDMGAQYFYKLPIFLFPDGTSSAVYQVLKDEGVQGSNGPITDVPSPVLRPVSFQQPWNASAGVTLTQLLFQPDVFVGLQARAASIDFAKKNIELSKEDVKDSAYKRYYAVLIAEKQLEFVNDGVKRIEKLVRDNEIMFKEGFIEKLDVDRARVQLSNLKTMQTTIRNGIHLSYAALKYALGLPQVDTLLLKDSLTIDEVKAGILDDAFQYENRKEFQLLQTSLELQKLDLKRYKLRYIPTVSLIGNFTRQAQAEKFIFSKDAFWYSTGYAGVNISVPIFDGFQRRYQVKQSMYQVEKAENNLENLKRVIDLQQTVNRESLKNALLSFDEQQRNIDLAEKVYNSTKLKFEQGLGNSFELIQAENDLQTSQSNYFQAMYDAIIAKISYQRSLGKL